MNGIVAFFVCLLPLMTMADLLPPPLPGEMPLHRIGYELVFEVLVMSAAGAAAVRALVKRRWKFRDELSTAEKLEFKRRIDAVLPRLVEEIVKTRQANERELNEMVARLLSENRELAAQVDGLPFEVLAKSVYECGFDRESPVAKQLAVVVPELIRGVASSGYVRMRDQKTLLENVLSRNDDLRQKLDGVPIELVNELLMPKLTQDVYVVRDCGDGSLWTTDEDRREVEAACRKRYRSPSMRHHVDDMEMLKELFEKLKKNK